MELTDLPAPLVPGLLEIGARLAAHGVDVDPLALCYERAEIVGLVPGGDQSYGRMTRLLATRDGWIAVALARADDVASIPAWLERDVTDDPWTLVTEEVATRDASELVARARLLGMPAAVLGEIAADAPVRTTRIGSAASREQVTVVDLSSLWAGPLCSRLLRDAGARVVKVESTQRPDARTSSPEFFARMNDGKEQITIDFTSGELAALLASADVVIEASRPRALEQLGIRPADVGAHVWVSITGYGRDEPGRNWVAFGDDAAVAGGLVVWDGAGPCFCLDAVADPLTGMTAAVAALDALAANDSVLLDVAMARVAAQFAQPMAATT
jgi:CoA-transferase family III